MTMANAAPRSPVARDGADPPTSLATGEGDHAKHGGGGTPKRHARPEELPGGPRARSAAPSLAPSTPFPPPPSAGEESGAVNPPPSQSDGGAGPCEAWWRGHPQAPRSAGGTAGRPPGEKRRAQSRPP